MTILVSVAILSYLVCMSKSLSCTSELQSLSCLPAFTHTPDNLNKCYCTSKCPDIETLRETCFSGQLQTDPCGVCLQCAPGFGEKCGGWANSEGVCAGGLGCLIKYRPGIETEHNKTGTCVTEQGEDCSNTGSGVSCRPGQIGVPTDFVFCPKQCEKQGNRIKQQEPGFLFAERNQNGEVGSIGGNIGEGVRNVVNNVPEQVREVVREILG